METYNFYKIHKLLFVTLRSLRVLYITSHCVCVVRYVKVKEEH